MASAHEASVSKTLGRQLRHALDQAYKKPPVMTGNPARSDVTALVQEYLPVGTQIDEAIAILQSAGCQVRREPRSEAASPESPPLVIASIEPFERHLLWTYYSSLRVQLTPLRESGVEVVGSVVATFWYPAL